MNKELVTHIIYGSLGYRRGKLGDGLTVNGIVIHASKIGCSG